MARHLLIIGDNLFLAYDFSRKLFYVRIFRFMATLEADKVELFFRAVGDAPLLKKVDSSYREQKVSVL